MLLHSRGGPFQVCINDKKKKKIPISSVIQGDIILRCTSIIIYIQQIYSILVATKYRKLVF